MRVQRRGDGVSRTRWAAIGAAVAVAFGGGGLLTALAADTPSAPSTYVGITPCRVVDTRPAPDNVGSRSTPIGSGETFSTAFIGAVGKCTIPAEAVAVVLNLAIVNPTANSFLTVFPAGGTVPLAANLNYVAGQPPASNAATVRIGTGGQLSFFNLRGTVDVTADVSGYYLPAATGGGTGTTVPPQPTPVIMTVDPFSMQLYNASQTTINNCVTTGPGSSSRFGVIPLSLPAGATVTSLSIAAYGQTGATWVATLMRSSLASTGNLSTQVFGTFGGTFSSNTVQSQISVGSSVVSQDDGWFVDVTLGASPTTVGICRVQVRYTLP